MVGRQHLFRFGRGFPGADCQSLRRGRSGGREKSGGSDLPGGSGCGYLRHHCLYRRQRHGPCMDAGRPRRPGVGRDLLFHPLPAHAVPVCLNPVRHRPPGCGRHQDAHVGGDHCQLHQYRPEFPADL